MKKANRNRHRRDNGRIFDILEWLLLHLTFIFSGMFITLWIFNVYNWQMEFLTSTLSNRLMIVYFTTGLLAAGLYIVRRAKRGFPRGQTIDKDGLKATEAMAVKKGGAMKPGAPAKRPANANADTSASCAPSRRPRALRTPTAAGRCEKAPPASSASSAAPGDKAKEKTTR